MFAGKDRGYRSGASYSAFFRVGLEWLIQGQELTKKVGHCPEQKILDYPEKAFHGQTL
jgi:hypothetical protein